jgi:HlyD family secretion protein
MDRPLGPGVRRRRLARRVVPVVAVGALLLLGLRWGSAALRPGVARRDIIVGRVDRGPLQVVLTAAGTVVPEVEQVVSMPVEARVLKIRKRPGDAVARGEAIFDLDLSAAELEQERLGQALALRANQQEQTRLGLQGRLNDLAGQHQMKQLQLAALRAQTERDRELHRRGLLARETLAQSELGEAQAAVDLQRIAADQEQARAATRVTLAGLALEMTTLRRERAAARRQLELATTRADRPGVVTWTLGEEGATVARGAAIARVADLRTFRVDATLPDVHAQRLSPGLPVIVKVSEGASDRPLSGTITAVNPTVRDGSITFTAALTDPSSPLLRPSLRVEVLVVVSRKNHVLRLPRAAFIEPAGQRQIFVIRGNHAVRTSVSLGNAGADHLEVLSGLHPGDEVILSDMTETLHLPTLDLN